VRELTESRLLAIAYRCCVLFTHNSTQIYNDSVARWLEIRLERLGNLHFFDPILACRGIYGPRGIIFHFSSTLHFFGQFPRLPKRWPRRAFTFGRLSLLTCFTYSGVDCSGVYCNSLIKVGRGHLLVWVNDLPIKRQKKKRCIE